MNSTTDDSLDESQRDTPFNPQSYWESRLAANYNLQGVGDIGLPRSYNDYLYRVRSHAFKLATKDLQDLPDLEILDVGSGTGFYINEWLNRQPKSLCGSDLTETAVRNLAERFPSAKFKQLDISTTDTLPLDVFDVVSCFDVLFHIVDDEKYSQAIKNIATMIKPGGHFVYSDNFMRSESTLEHQKGRRESTINAELEKRGLRIVRRVPMFVLMNDPGRSDSRLRKKLFSIVYRLASRSERWGTIVGSTLLPFEKLLISMQTRGPSTEIVFCEKA